MFVAERDKLRINNEASLVSRRPSYLHYSRAGWRIVARSREFPSLRRRLIEAAEAKRRDARKKRRRSSDWSKQLGQGSIAFPCSCDPSIMLHTRRDINPQGVRVLSSERYSSFASSSRRRCATAPGDVYDLYLLDVKPRCARRSVNESPRDVLCA